MRKILLSVLTLMLCVNLFAIDYTGKITVAIYDGSHIANATVSESTDVAPGVIDNGYCNPVQDLGAMSVAIYAYYENVAYENLLLNSLKNMPLNFKANAATAYHLYFANLEGTITLYDTKTAQFVDMTSNPYDFTIEASERDANNIVANRFVINYVPAPVYSVKTNIDGWASYSSDVDLVAPTGLTVYAGTIDDEELILTSVNYIKANEGVIVKGEASQTYTLTPGSGSGSYTNELKPSSAWVSHSGTIYCLHNEGVGTTAFYQYTGSDMPANKAYLQISTTPSSAPKRISMRFNQPTAIENVELEAVKAEKFIENGQVFIKRGEIIYNVQGQIVK